MEWLPRIDNFRNELRDAALLSDATQRLERLSLLAQSKLEYLQAIQLDRAISGASGEPVLGFRSLRVAVLSSCTADHLLPSIRVAGLRRRWLIEARTGGYNQYRQDILDRASWLREWDPDVIVFSVSARDFVETVPLNTPANAVESLVSHWVDDLRRLWASAMAREGRVVVQQALLDVHEPLFGSHDQCIPTSPSRLVHELNERLSVAAAGAGVLWLDVARASARDGLSAWFDMTRWLSAKMEIAPRAASMYGELLARLLAAQRGQSRKCLVLDLDNTLWGGIVGEVGVEGLCLGPGSALGEAFQQMQRYAKRLSQRGIVLAVCSKNDCEIAETAFRVHPEMVLERTDIAAFVANWEDKAKNLRAIAADLNLGLDSLVFVDDSPAERARVRQSLPMVAVPELPEDPGQYVRCIAEAGYFEAVSFTADDAQRTRQYAANTQREALKDSSQSLDDFLRQLRMEVVHGPIEAVHVARAAQLLNKTNQFNTTGRRYSVDEVGRRAAEGSGSGLLFRLIDRFGDNGLVSVMLLGDVEPGSGCLQIANWVMSCRVFGRQLEFEAMNILVEAARGLGARTLCADYVPTERNGIVRPLYELLGFSRQPRRAESSPETESWALRLSDYQPRPTHITRADRST